MRIFNLLMLHVFYRLSPRVTKTPIQITKSPNSITINNESKTHPETETESWHLNGHEPNNRSTKHNQEWQEERLNDSSNM